MLRRLILDAVHIRIRETEMVADLMNKDVGDKLIERDVAALAPFGENGTAI